jgi:serine/threonine protein kinase
LKPGNILIDAAGKPWLTDFGLAKFSTSESTLTLTSDHIGTPHYMSPEMAAGRVRECSAACDVWALGVILWEMLSGRPPFMGGSAVEILRNIVEQEPLPPGELLRQNADLLTIARRCMEKRPADRPDGRWLAAGGEGAPACLWDLRAPDIAASRREAPAPAPLSGAVSFSPDNRRLAIGTGDGILHLWEWQNPDPAWNLTTLRTPEAIHTIAWLRDGRLLTGGAGPAVSLWEMEVAKLVQRARQTAGRELAPAERVRFGLGK